MNKGSEIEIELGSFITTVLSTAGRIGNAAKVTFK